MNHLTPTDVAESYPDDLTTGVPVRLSTSVLRILAPNPGMMTGPGTNTYLVGSDEVTVIDPGPADPGHIDAIIAAGAGRITRVLCTHTHIDHWPAAVDLAERLGCEVLAFDARDGLVPSAMLAHGDEIVARDHRLRAVHTPGHASNHLCYLLEADAMLFSGDHLMQGSTVVISPPDGDMAAYLASLDMLCELDPPLASIAPAHGHVLAHPAEVIAAVRAHRLDRERIIADALAAKGAETTVDELVPDVYADVHPALYPVARRSLWAHLRKLVADGRAGVDDPDDLDAGRWRSL